jgi:hypothetical protein
LSYPFPLPDVHHPILRLCSVQVPDVLYPLTFPTGEGNTLDKVLVEKGINPQSGEGENHRSCHNIVPITDKLTFKRV